MKHFFNSKYPIIAAAMNQVSDLNLAIACYKEGIVASISAFNYIGAQIDVENMSKDLESFVNLTNSKNLIFSISTSLLKIPKIVEIINENNFGAIELAVWNPLEFHLLKNIKSPIILKTTCSDYYEKMKFSFLEDYVDAIIIKGKDGAGTVNLNNNLSLKELFLTLKDNHPKLSIIPSGGISTSKQIKEFLDLGAEYVSIGSLFAFSSESKISKETKEKIVNSSFEDVVVFENSSQHAIKFGNISETDNFNNTKSLIKGMQNPSEGHVFIGKGVDNINKIQTVNEIVNDLIKDLS